MTSAEPEDRGDLEAGPFTTWLDQLQSALSDDGATDVPCNGCTACCTSSQFVHIGPDERDALAHIPPDLLFPAPRLPAGHLLMGYDERGHCPMLLAGACSIYQHRPRACRTYDCRVFPATGIFPAEADKAAIADQARRWRFSFPTTRDDAARRAVRAAAASVRTRSEGSATQQAVEAIRSLGPEGTR